MTNQEIFTQAYLEAIDFTELGDGDQQPPVRAELTALSRAKALNACACFYQAYKDEIGENIEQAGHDFWLTRQRHGAGFWDRPEVYGKELADALTKACHAVGEVDEVDFGERAFSGLPNGARFLTQDNEEYRKGSKGWAVNTRTKQEQKFKGTDVVWGTEL